MSLSLREKISLGTVLSGIPAALLALEFLAHNAPSMLFWVGGATFVAGLFLLALAENEALHVNDKKNIKRVR